MSIYRELLSGFVLSLFVLVLPLNVLGEEQTESNSVSKSFLDNLETKSIKDVETFSPPKPIKINPPKYPRRAFSDQKEGWVSVNFMVDDIGKPYEIAVTGYSNETFVKAAIRAVEKWDFQPASIDDRSIDAATSFRITFELSGPSQASGAVRKAYSSAISAIRNKNRDEAQQVIDRMKIKKANLYEEAYYWLARYYFAQTWEDEDRQYSALQKALYRDSSEKYFLPKRSVGALLLNKLDLEIKQSYLRDALETSSLLGKYSLTDGDLKYIEGIVSQIKRIRDGDGLVVVNGRVGAGNSSYHRLLKSQFSFSEVKGDIAELRLRCEKGYVGFIYKEGTAYEAESGVGECSLQIIGDPGTTFKLLEL